MKTRTTMDNLLSLVTRINAETSATYYIDSACGGVRLLSENGGNDILSTGFVSKKLLYDCMYSFFKGIIIGKNLIQQNDKV